MNLLRLPLRSGCYMHGLNNKVQKKISEFQKYMYSIGVLFFRFSSFYKSRRLEQYLQKPVNDV